MITLPLLVRFMIIAFATTTIGEARPEGVRKTSVLKQSKKNTFCNVNDGEMIIMNGKEDRFIETKSCQILLKGGFTCSCSNIFTSADENIITSAKHCFSPDRPIGDYSVKYGNRIVPVLSLFKTQKPFVDERSVDQVFLLVPKLMNDHFHLNLTLLNMFKTGNPLNGRYFFAGGYGKHSVGHTVNTIQVYNPHYHQSFRNHITMTTANTAVCPGDSGGSFFTCKTREYDSSTMCEILGVLSTTASRCYPWIRETSYGFASAIDIELLLESHNINNDGQRVYNLLINRYTNRAPPQQPQPQPQPQQQPQQQQQQPQHQQQQQPQQKDVLKTTLFYTDWCRGSRDFMAVYNDLPCFKNLETTRFHCDLDNYSVQRCNQERIQYLPTLKIYQNDVLIETLDDVASWDKNKLINKLNKSRVNLISCQQPPTPLPPSSGDITPLLNSVEKILKLSVYHVDWCGDCKRFMPVFYSLPCFENVEYTNVDCVKNDTICRQEQIHEYPTLKIYLNNVLVETVGEIISYNDRQKMINKMENFTKLVPCKPATTSKPPVITTKTTPPTTPFDDHDEFDGDRYSKNYNAECDCTTPFENIVDNKTVSMVFYYVDWCQHATIFARDVFNKIPCFENVTMRKFNCDVDEKSREHCVHANITGYPFVRIYRGRYPIESLPDGGSFDEIIKSLQRHVKLSPCVWRRFDENTTTPSTTTTQTTPSTTTTQTTPSTTTTTTQTTPSTTTTTTQTTPSTTTTTQTTTTTTNLPTATTGSKFITEEKKHVPSELELREINNRIDFLCKNYNVWCNRDACDFKVNFDVCSFSLDDTEASLL